MNQAIRRDKPTFRERLRRGLLLFAGLYFLICAGGATFQRRLIYYPSVLTREQVDQMAQAAGLERWTNSAGQFIGLKRRSPKQPAEGSVMIMNGNGSTAVGSGHYADEIQTAAAFDVFSWNIPVTRTVPVRPASRVCFMLPTKHSADCPPTSRSISSANRSARVSLRTWPAPIQTKSRASCSSRPSAV